MRRRVVCVLIALVVSACGGSKSSPTAPSSSTSTAPASLSGTVTVTGTSVKLNGATIRILDGPNAGRTTVTDGGTYRFDNVTPGNANVSASADGWEEQRAGITIAGASTLNFTIRTTEPWQVIAANSQAFTMPAWVSRVVIVAIYHGFCQNFVVRIGGRLVVNEILGTCSSGVGTQFSGSFAVSGTDVQVTGTGVAWGIQEIRDSSPSAQTDLLDAVGRYGVR